MTDLKETVTTTNEEGLTNQGAQVKQQTRQISTQTTTDSKTTATNLIWYLVGLIEILLAFRFALKLFGANPASGFVNFIYSVTNVLTAPFDTIFGVVRAEAGDVSSVFEPSILVAAAVYALVGWGIVKLITVNQKS